MSWGAPCAVSSRATIRLFGRSELWVRAGIGQVKFAELKALRTKYGRDLRAFGQSSNANATFAVQTYACRAIRGGAIPSMHSWPRAADIKPWLNPMRDDGVLTTDFRKYGLVDGLRWVNAWLWSGFRWGATWSGQKPMARRFLLRVGQKVRDGRVDPMHFELYRDQPWSRAKTIRRLRRYGARHLRYWRHVKRRARVKTAGQLYDAWLAGRA